METIRQFRHFLAMFTLLLVLGCLVAPTTAIRQVYAQDAVHAAITANPSSASQGKTITLSFAGFFPGEQVTIWQTFPDITTVVPLGNASLNKLGSGERNLTLDASLPAGRHHFTARGNSSGLLAITAFDIIPANDPISANVNISVVFSDHNIVFTGAGYHPKESVALWVNKPDFSVMELGTARTNDSGDFEFAALFDRRFPMGHYSVVAVGRESELTASQSFEVTTPPATVVRGR